MKSSLAELHTRARSMDAGMAERDALLLELSRSPEAHESPRARADVLRLIIEDPWLGGFSGSDGRRLDQAALRALLALGEPYASELSPRLKTDLALRPEGTPLPVVQRPRGVLGKALVTVIGSLELLFVLWDTHKTVSSLVIGLSIIIGSTFLPAFIPRAPRGSPLDLVRRGGMVLLGIITGGWSLFALGFLLEQHEYPLAQGSLIGVAAMHLTALISLSRVPNPSLASETPAPAPPGE